MSFDQYGGYQNFSSDWTPSDLYDSGSYTPLLDVDPGSAWGPSGGGALTSGYGATLNPDGSVSYDDSFNGPYLQPTQLGASFDKYSVSPGSAGPGLGRPTGDWTSEWTSGSVPDNIVAKPKGSWMSDLMVGLGLQGKDGKTDLKDKKQVDAWMKTLTGGANILNALLGGNKPRGYLSAAELQAQLQGKYGQWNPAQRSTFDAYFGTPTAARSRMSAADLSSPIRAGVGYAEGGDVGGLEALLGAQDMGGGASPGALSLVAGAGGGQDDMVPAQLSPGEYVWDADVVSAFGDGDNAQGAAILDAVRQNIRSHKRSAPPDQIPPKALDFMQYLPKGGV